MTEPAEPAEPTEPAPTATTWLDRIPSFTRIRAGLVMLGLLGVWFAMAIAWSEVFGDMALFDASIIVFTAILVFVTALWLASLRVATLRRALLPLDAGIIVGGIVFAIGARGMEVDSVEDVAAIALVLGVITTIVIAVVARLLEGRRSEPIWIGSLVALAICAGVAIPAIADQLVYGDIDPYPATPYSAVLSHVRVDGSVTLGDTGSVRLDGSYDESSNGYLSVSEGSMDPTVVAETLPPPPPGSTVPTAVKAPWLTARRDGALELRFARVPASKVPLYALVASGACGDRTGPTTPLATPQRLTVRTGSDEQSLALRGIRLTSLAPGDQLHVVLGSGASLAPVECIDLLDPTTAQLAQAGLVQFGEECVAPLHLQPGQQLQLTSASFQSEGCAAKLERLTTIAPVPSAPIGTPVPAVGTDEAPGVAVEGPEPIAAPGY